MPLVVRWDLGPVNSEQVDGGDRAFWTRAYENVKNGSRKVASHYNLGRPPISLRLGIWLGIALRLLVPKCMACQLK